MPITNTGPGAVSWLIEGLRWEIWYFFQNGWFVAVRTINELWADTNGFWRSLFCHMHSYGSRDYTNDGRSREGCTKKRWRRYFNFISNSQTDRTVFDGRRSRTVGAADSERFFVRSPDHTHAHYPFLPGRQSLWTRPVIYALGTGTVYRVSPPQDFFLLKDSQGYNLSHIRLVNPKKFKLLSYDFRKKSKTPTLYRNDFSENVDGLIFNFHLRRELWQFLLSSSRIVLLNTEASKRNNYTVVSASGEYCLN